MRRTPYLSPLLIAFGASWCKPCLDGLPRLKAFTKKHPELRLMFIAVETDAEKAQQLVTKTGIAEVPAILDKVEVVAKAYGVAGEQRTQLPRTFLVDAGGRRCGRSTRWRGTIWRRCSRWIWRPRSRRRGRLRTASSKRSASAARG